MEKKEHLNECMPLSIPKMIHILHTGFSLHVDPKFICIHITFCDFG